MGRDRARVGESTDTLSSYVQQNRHNMMTDEDGYGGVSGWCVDLACGYPDSGELFIHHHHFLKLRRCKTSSVGQSGALVIPRLSVRFWQILKKSRTHFYMDLSYIDPQARVLNYCYK